MQVFCFSGDNEVSTDSGRPETMAGSSGPDDGGDDDDDNEEEYVFHVLRLDVPAGCVLLIFVAMSNSRDCLVLNRRYDYWEFTGRYRVLTCYILMIYKWHKLMQIR